MKHVTCVSDFEATLNATSITLLTALLIYQSVQNIKRYNHV